MVKIAERLEQWRESYGERDPSETEKIEFVRGTILSDIKVRNMNVRRWNQVQKTHPDVRWEEFDLWCRIIWRIWLVEKIKIAKRKQTGRRRKMESNDNDTSGAPNCESTSPILDNSHSVEIDTVHGTSIPLCFDDAC